MASFDDIRAKMNKKYGDSEEEKKKKQQEQKEKSPSAATDFSTIRNDMNSKYNSSYSHVDANFINTFLSDAKSFLNSAYDNYSGMGYSNRDTIYNEHSKKADELKTKSWDIRQYLTKNKDSLKEEDYSSLIAMLDDFDKTAMSTNYSLYKKKEGISKFENEAYYNEHQRQQELGAMSTAEIEEARKGRVVDQEDKDIIQELMLSNMPYRRDYAEQDGRDMGLYDEVEQKRKYISDKYGIQFTESSYENDRLLMDIMNGDTIAYTTYSGQNITWDSLYNNASLAEDLASRFETYSKNADWAEKSQAINTVADTESDYQILTEVALSGVPYDWETAEATGIDRATFDHIESKRQYISNKYGVDLYSDIYNNANILNDLMAKLEEQEGERDVFEYISYLNPQEKAVLSYIKETEGRAAALAWHNSRKDIYRSRYNEAITSGWADLGKEHPFWGSVGSVALNLGASVEYLDDIFRYAATGETPDNTMARAASSIRSGVMDKYDWKWGDADVFDFLYGTFMSGVDSWTAGKLGSLAGMAAGLEGEALAALAGNIGGTQLGLSAAGQATNDALARGMSDGQAISTGIAAGIFEGLFEKWSIGSSVALQQVTSAHGWDIAKNIAKSVFINASEEFNTEVANIFYDLIFNGDFSQYETSVRQYMAMGYSQKEAKSMAAKDLGMQVAEAAASGALMGFGFGGVDSSGAIWNNAKNANRRAAQTYNIGKATLNADGGMDALQALAMDVSGASDSKLAKKTEKLNGEISTGEGKIGKAVATVKNMGKNWSAGKAYRAIESTVSEKNKADLTTALKENGLSEKSAKNLAEAIVVSLDGKQLSNFQKSTLESFNGNKKVGEVITKVFNDADSSVKQRVSNLSKFNLGIKFGVGIAPGDSTASAVESKAKTIEKTSYEVSEGGKTILDGTEVKLNGLRKMEDGSVVVATADNQTADPSEVQYPSEGHALIYENYANIETTTNNPVIANMDVEDRSTLAMTFDPGTGVAAKAQFLGLNHAYWYGFEGMAMDEKTLPENTYIKDISEKQRNIAYELGRKAAEKAAKTQKAALDAAYEKAVEKLGGEEKAKAAAAKKSGNVILASGIKESSMTLKEKASYEMAKVVAKSIGTDIHIYRGMKEYGKYSSKTGDIWLNINANISGQSMMAFTLGHELVHMAKQWSSDKFKAFADYLLEQYGKKGISVEALIRDQMANAKLNGYTLDEHEAYEEVIADACQRMLLDSNAVQKMAEYKNENPGQWQQIIDKIKAFIDKIRKAFAGVEPDSNEAALFKELDDFAKNELEKRFVDMVMDAGEHLSVIRAAFGKGTVVEVNANGEFTLAKGKDSNGATKFLYNDYTWEKGGRDTLSAALKAEGYSEEDIKAALTIMDGKHDLVKQLEAQFPEQARINQATITTDLKDGHSVLSALVSNGDYPVNIDLLMVCKKRKAYQRVINRLGETGMIQHATVDALAIAEINKILGKYGFETACLGCFVESRRLRIQEWAETIVKEWNAEVNKRNPNAKAFGFGKGEATLTPDEVMQLVGELEGHEKNDQGNLNLGQGSAVKRMGVLLDKVPSLRKTLSVEDLITPDGLSSLRKYDSNLFSMVKSRYGSNSPKFVQEFNPYNHELAMYGKVPSEYKSLREYLYAIGGARMQSFSDFIVENWFDYCQIVADLAARKLPMHTYTKEISLAKLFGLTGIKINMSLIPDIDRSLGKEYAGLTRNAKGELELIWADKDRYKATGGKSYMQSINFADAIALQNDPRYSANVGTIAVGVSDKHILMMLDDNRIRMIIPYHSSGMNPIFADLMGTSYYKDYTMVQNTTVKQLYNSKGDPVSMKLEKEQSNKLTSGFQFNTVLQELGDARAAAQAYKDWCADASKHTITIKGETYTAELTPKFDDFSGHENYYKLLEDFNTYDCISEEAAPQGDVQQTYPEDFDETLKAELKAQEKHRQKQEETQAFDNAMGEIESYLSTHTKADTVFYAEQHGVKLSAKDKKLNAADKAKLADLRKGMKMSMPKVATDAVEKFGTTTNFEQAGFVIGDGRMLNLSQYGLNGVKHQRIEQVYDDVKGSEAINRFIQEGHVRIKASSPGIEIGSEVAPTVSQFNTISKFINTSLVKKGYFYLDITGKNGETIASVEYDEDASAEDVIWDIKDYYNRGKIPKPSSYSYSMPKTKAPTFYSQMAKVVDGLKQEKHGAASVISTLRNKGVKAEEIKWSGIEAWLEGKKSVTKAELQEFIAGSMLQIDEEILDNKDRPYTEDQQKRLDEYEAKRDEVAKQLADEWKKLTGEEFPIHNAGAGLESSLVNKIIDANKEHKDASFEGRLLKKLRKDLEGVIENNDDFGFDSWKDALRSIHRHRKDFIKKYEMSTNDKAVIVKYCNALNAYNELPSRISDEDADRLRAIARETDPWNRKIMEVKHEHNEEEAKYMTNWRQYSLEGGRNYREMLFRIPGSAYTNEAMMTHWKERKGVLAHARVQDMDTFLGKMLFIEEIQSDWHNAGHKDGYRDPGTDDKYTVAKKMEKFREEFFESPIAKVFEERISGVGYEGAGVSMMLNYLLDETDYTLDVLSRKGVSFTDSEKSEIDKYVREYGEMSKQWESAPGDLTAPDAPFKDTYHEYVLKRLLREAAEQDYDSIGWTTAETQDERWQNNLPHKEGTGKSGFLKGYTVEYDQDIPKFLSKLGKKWGTSVGKTVLDNGTEVWSMAITDEMKDSVLYEGQPKYSMPKKRTFTYNELVARGSITGEVIKSSDYVHMKAGLLDEDWLVNRVKRDCKQKKTKAPEPTYYAEVPDIGRNVEVTRDGILHGCGNYKKNKNGVLPPSAVINARITPNLVNILKTAIEVNQSRRGSNIDVPFSHIMLGVAGLENADGTVDYYGVRIEIEERVNQDPILVEASVFGKLFAVNANKISSPHAQVTGGAGVALTTGSFSYNIADLLKDVKKDFDDTFSVDVYRKLKMSRKKNVFSENLLFKAPNSHGMSPRQLLADAFDELVQTPDERKLMDQYRNNISKVEDVQERLRKLRAEISKLTKANGDKAKIAELNKTAKELAELIDKYDRKLLDLEASKPLKDVLARAKSAAYQEAKKRNEETMKEYRQQVSERFDRGVEGRRKTATRHKIQRVVGELNNLLLSEDKKSKVPDSLKKAVAGALSLVNMDTVGADDRIAKYEVLIAKEEAKANPDQDKIDAYTVTLENIKRQGEKMGQRLKELRDAYEEIQNSDDPDIANGYDPVISGSLKELAESIGNTSLRNMTIEQLEDVYDMYKMVLTRVRDANKSLIESIKESISNRASMVIGQVKKVGGEHKDRASILDPVRTFIWNNAKPVYAMEHIGSDALTEAYNNVRAGEDTWAKDVTEARAYYLDKSKKYGYDSWDFDKKYTFESTSGLEFELTLEQMMALYAYSKRDQAHEHLRLGGFVFDSNIESYKETVEEKDGKAKRKKSILKYKVNTADAHQLSVETLGDIISTIENEAPGAKEFVDEMQDYLSTVMGMKGNEVTMKMYGVKLFKEKFYFPLKSAKQFLFEKNEVAGEVKIKNSGFTNKTKPQANNPIILNNFMDVWANHVNDMSMYHSFVLPLEDFNRIFNYYSQKQEGVPPVSVQGTLQNAYSPAAVSYIKQLITDLNGGAMSDPRETFAKAMTSKFKKAKVFSSLSVVIQQPSAIGRAFALVDPKYFRPTKDGMNHDQLWAELKKYAPVAIIKEMGYFDTNMGRSTLDFIKAKEYSTFKEKAKAFFADEGYRDEQLSRLPALADEITWCAIWNAVKRETVHNHKDLRPGSEEFMNEAGKRFTEVVTKTQVYDSVLSRSANMRSKGSIMSMVTSFMAEPTTSINMLEDAIIKSKRGNKNYAARAFASVGASILINNALVAIIYAMRDDDEDETWVEKYSQSFVSNMLDDINPITYYPYLKDIWSLFQGYDIERADMSLFGDLADSAKRLVQAYSSEDGDVPGAWWDLLGTFANLGGVPLHNIVRDFNGGINFVKTLAGDFNGRTTTWSSMGHALLDTVKDSTPIWGWLPDEKTSDRLYDAIISGDTAYVNRLKNSHKDEDAYSNAVRKALRDNDPRVKEAALAQINGNPSERVRIAKLIIADGFTQDDVVRAINAEINALTSDDSSSGTKKEKGFYTAEDFAREIANGDQAAANAAKSDVIWTAQKNGKTAEEAEKSFNSSAKSELKDLFLADKVSEDKAVKALVTYCGESEEDALEIVGKWLFEDMYGFSYSDRADAYKSGKISASQMKAILMDEGGMTAEEAGFQVEAYDWESQGYKGATAAAVREYNEHCTSTNVPKDIYLYIRTFSNNTENDKDANGKSIAYSAMKKIMAEINAQTGLTSAQKTAIARSLGWADKNIQKYKPW